MKSPLCFCLVFAISSVIAVNNLREEFTWTRIDYDWGNNRRTRDVELEERYGYSSNRGTTKRPETHHQQEELYFPDSAPGYNSGARPGSGFRPGGTNGRKPTLKPYNPQNQNYGGGHQNQGGNREQSQNLAGGQSSSQTRENYIYQNNIPMGAGVWGDKLFITVPRRRHGVPSSLNYVSLNSQNKHNTPLIPYPNWEMNALPENYNSSNFDSSSLSSADRNRFVSVYRVAVDSCDRLWFVDTGRLEIPDAPIQVQSPKLVIMDLRTDRVLRQYTFPESDLRQASLFAHVVVETEPNDCTNAYAYIPDVGGYGLVVYSLRDNRSWRVTHNYFYLEPLRGEFQIAGHTFQWNDGVFSTALSPLYNGRRDLYFHSMAGTNLYRVPTEILKNETAATRSYHGQDFETIGDRGEGSQTSASALDEKTGVLLLGLVNQNALACWNINRPLTDVSIVQRDDEKMIYPCDLKVYNDNIYLLTNTMPGFLYGQLDYNIVNFRVWVQTVREAIKGTSCEAGSGNSYGGSGGSRGGSKGNRYGSSGSRGGSYVDNGSYASRGSYMG
ncbi:L-dopachrome tautomerase yellow-f2-like [Coccinella septempunctata]|uniref:L-dopachrome tautomerase yellow-f2-like n=1 Tax=Coccinella septempunctata TaxID=41139 RepID=UPI001D063375|nr:L-dopachrome tautomerase yellow-f2-like [Coccinella septempunctata]